MFFFSDIYMIKIGLQFVVAGHIVAKDNMLPTHFHALKPPFQIYFTSYPGQELLSILWVHADWYIHKLHTCCLFFGKTFKIPRMKIRFWPKTGSGALYLRRREIFKSLLNQYFRWFFLFFILLVSDVTKSIKTKRKAFKII